MAVSMDFIADVLTQCGACVYRQNDGLLATSSLQGESMAIVVRLDEAGQLVHIHVPGVLSTVGAVDLESVLQRLLFMNGDWRLCRFSHMPATGEVALEVEMPVHDSTLSATQIHRIWCALRTVLSSVRTSLRKHILTGVNDELTIDSSVRALLEPEGHGERAA